MAGLAKKPAAKGAKVVAKKKAYTNRQVYEVSGDSIKRIKKTCPKCGEGIFLAEHANRVTCGKCAYTEFKK